MRYRIKEFTIAGFALTFAGLCCVLSILMTPDLLIMLRGEEPSPPPAQTVPKSKEPQSNVICPMEWVSPTTSFNAGVMPASGAMPVDWTDNPGASGYDLTVVTPNGSPVNYDVDGSSKDLFLENFHQTGNYQIVVTALDADGNPLCAITMNFEMPVVTAIDPSNDNNDGDGSNVPAPSVPSATEPPPVP